MGMFDNFSWNPMQSSIFTGAGTPWGAPSQKGGLYDALTTGKGTPWGVTGQKGIQGGADSFSQGALNFANSGLGGNITDKLDSAAFTGEGTPWAADGKKSMDVARDPLMTFIHDKAGKGSDLQNWEDQTNKGQLQVLGMNGKALEAPDQNDSKYNYNNDPNSYGAPDMSAYNQAGQENINRSLARSRNSMAAWAQKHGALSSGDAGLGFGDIAQSGMEQRGGLANAIAGMQYQNQMGQRDQARNLASDRYSNDYANYQNDANARNQNRQTVMNNTGIAGAIFGKIPGFGR